MALNNMNYFKEKRVVIKDCVYPEFNGLTTIISEAKTTNTNDVLLCTDLQHPEYPNDKFWLRLKEVAYIKEYDHYFIQYRDKQGLTINKPFSDDENGTLKVNGHFDVYKKVYPPFNY